MAEVDLAVKAYKKEDAFQALLGKLAELKDLDFAFDIRVKKGWISLRLDGRDSRIVASYLTDLYGSRPKSHQKGDVVRGYVLPFSEEGLPVDVGSFSVVVSPEVLRAQLCDGKALPVEEISELFAFKEHVPIRVQLLDPPFGRLSFSELRRIREWVRTYLDRVIVVGNTFSSVKRALRKLALMKYVVDIEKLGLLEHSIVLRIDTPSEEVTQKLRGRLGNCYLFSPQKIIARLGKRFLSPW